MTTTPSVSAAPALQIAAPTPKTGIAADFNMFLKLLTTQMQNQDPLSPMDSTQFTQQLVQYSQVEQSVQQNTTLKDILARLSTQDVSQAAGFIGKDAVFSSAVSGLGAQPANWNYTTDRAIASGTATITDAAGKTIFTRALNNAEASGSFTWNGALPDGTKAANGAYTLAIKGVDANGTAMTAKINSTGTVNTVSTNNGVLSLGVNGVPMSIGTLLSLAGG